MGPDSASWSTGSGEDETAVESLEAQRPDRAERHAVEEATDPVEEITEAAEEHRPTEGTASGTTEILDAVDDQPGGVNEIDGIDDDVDRLVGEHVAADG